MECGEAKSAADIDTDPFAGKPRPPHGLVPRLRFYGERNGYLYSALGFLGRRSPRFWSLVGPIFSRSRLRRWLRAPGPRFLNLGGGSNVFDRWLTADVDPRADVYVDVTKPLPFKDGVVEVVYLEEVIEHVTNEEARALIAECMRILKPLGILRLTTPDLDSYARRFDGSTFFERKINDIFYGHGHRHVYSRNGARELLVDAGFTKIKESTFRDRESRFGYFDTHSLRFSISDPELSQYWEAEKDG